MSKKNLAYALVLKKKGFIPYSATCDGELDRGDVDTIYMTKRTAQMKKKYYHTIKKIKYTVI